MKYPYYCALKATLYLVLLVFCSVWNFQSCNEYKKSKNYTEVTGTIYGKSESLRSKYKSRDVYSEYRFAIRPDNPEYTSFDTTVSFSTYCQFSKGQKITFKEIPNRLIGKESQYWVFFVWGFSSCILFGTLGILLIVIIGSSIESRKYYKNCKYKFWQLGFAIEN